MRLAAWGVRLAEWCRQRQGEPFMWGTNDCAILCLEAVDALRGSSLAAEYRGRWHDRRSAIKFQLKRGTDLRRTLEGAGVFVWPGEPLPGDLVLAPVRPFMAGHVVLGETVLGAKEAEGICLCWTRDALAQPGAVVMRVT